ncbi:hypothetical protein [Chachezhania sediminis]|uniref:hypothetical protein n=1 Tax=Chachezhania sediminis TaxID=2599291 RepID=UPI001E298E9B|nr:hypothetical protein [Chachezhania sediminis]
MASRRHLGRQVPVHVFQRAMIDEGPGAIQPGLHRSHGETRILELADGPAEGAAFDDQPGQDPVGNEGLGPIQQPVIALVFGRLADHLSFLMPHR